MKQELPNCMDNLKNTKGLIDLDGNSEGFFGLDDYKLSVVFDELGGCCAF